MLLLLNLITINRHIIYFPSDYGFYKLEAKTKTSSGIEFTTNSSSNHDSGKFLGNLETKFSWADYGESFVLLGIQELGLKT